MQTKLSVKVTSNTKSDEIMGLMDDGTLKIRIKAKPIEGRANKHLRKFLSKKLDLNICDIEIISGRKSNKKVLKINYINSENLREKLGLS